MKSKKTFTKPLLKRYELQLNEDIAGSPPSILHGEVGITYYTMSNNQIYPQPELDPNEYCYELLVNTGVEIPWSTMSDMVDFNAWYVDHFYVPGDTAHRICVSV